MRSKSENRISDEETRETRKGKESQAKKKELHDYCIINVIRPFNLDFRKCHPFFAGVEKKNVFLSKITEGA